MEINIYLRYILYIEIFALFIIFIPFFIKYKRWLILHLIPIFSKLKYLFWIVWCMIAFIFVNTFKDAYIASVVNMDIMSKLDLARNERDSLLSFIVLLLLPLLSLHSKSITSIFKLQQSNIALAIQGKNVSKAYSDMLTADMNKGKQQKSKNVSNKEDIQRLRAELDGLKSRLHIAHQQRDGYHSELVHAKDQLHHYSMFEKAAKKKN